jgi:hypothetical protein
MSRFMKFHVKKSEDQDEEKFMCEIDANSLWEHDFTLGSYVYTETQIL